MLLSLGFILKSTGNYWRILSKEIILAYFRMINGNRRGQLGVVSTDSGYHSRNRKCEGTKQTSAVGMEEGKCGVDQDTNRERIFWPQ